MTDKLRICVDNETREILIQITDAFQDIMSSKPEWADKVAEEIAALKQHVEDIGSKISEEQKSLIKEGLENVNLSIQSLSKGLAIQPKWATSIVEMMNSIKTDYMAFDKKLNNIETIIVSVKPSWTDELVIDIKALQTQNELALNELVNLRQVSASIGNMIKELEDSLHDQSNIIIKQQEHLEYLSLPWWKRIFGGKYGNK